MATDTVDYKGSGLYIPPALQEWLDTVLLVNTRPKLVYNLFADNEHKTMPLHKGMTIRFDRWMPLPPRLAPLTTAQTPSPDDIEIQKVYATIKQYGGWLAYSDVVDLTNDRNPILTKYVKMQSDQVALTEDLLTRNTVIAGASGTSCNLDLSDPGAATTTLPAALETAELALMTNNAEKFTEIIKASTGVGTEPIPASYFAIGHTDLLKWLKVHPDWIPVHKYPNTKGIREAEYGAIGNIRFLLTTNGAVTYNAGSPGAPQAGDVYKISIFAKHAYAVTKLQGGNLSAIVHPVGSGGSSDPLDQRGSVGWKLFRASEILDDRYMFTITCTVVA